MLFYKLRNDTLILEKQKKTESLDYNVLMFQENLVKFLSNIEFRSKKFDEDSGKWAFYCLFNMLRSNFVEETTRTFLSRFLLLLVDLDNKDDLVQ